MAQSAAGEAAPTFNEALAGLEAHGGGFEALSHNRLRLHHRPPVTRRRFRNALGVRGRVDHEEFVNAARRFAPPAHPWRPLVLQDDAGAYLSVYLSSPLARLPVRDVTRVGDNKSDPNLETMTFGLFSTCEPRMRGSIANRGIGEIFFLTNIEGKGRALVGTYELGWLIEVEKGDFALAARSAKFVDPIPVTSFRGRTGEAVRKRIRGYMRIDESIASRLRAAIHRKADRTDRYLAEIARLERMSLSRTGFRYPSWDRTEPFSWSEAKPFLSDPSDQEGGPNVSETGVWICAACDARIVNRARLKVCNVCRSRGTLIPEPTKS